MSETMMLALEDWTTDFSLGRDLKEEQVMLTGQVGQKSTDLRLFGCGHLTVQ